MDHTLFRKYENLSGRWTGSDPVPGNLKNPKSFNRYGYVEGDPVNTIDPTGALGEATGGYCSPMFSSCAGTGGGGYSGTPFDSGSIIFGGYNEVPVGIRAGLMAFDRRVAITTLIYRLIHASPSGATPDEIDKYRAAMADLIGRIMTRPKCAELFGGIENALGTLGNTNFSVEDRGSPAMLPTGLYTPPVAYTVDNSITINRSGPFFHPIQTINFMGIMMPATVNNWGLQGSGYGALVLGHELGHVVGIYGANDHDSGSQQVNDQNTQKVFDACFK
ncbi:MAG TPA: RHS repeat-associated core domain-containing protein [Pyrinomonadaceae bacterium]|nr:RHS repeat-associated core domain-containing protein [Pyrinomonadaceae bacterium]